MAEHHKWLWRKPARDICCDYKQCKLEFFLDAPASEPRASAAPKPARISKSPGAKKGEKTGKGNVIEPVEITNKGQHSAFTGNTTTLPSLHPKKGVRGSYKNLKRRADYGASYILEEWFTRLDCNTRLADIADRLLGVSIRA